MRGFVLDASLALAWCFEDEASPISEALLDRTRAEGGHAPAIWPVEVANALLVGERRGRLKPAATLRFIGLIEGLPITVDAAAPARAWRTAAEIARAHNLSVYDASYIDLAARLVLPLATVDARMREAARQYGIHLVAEGEA